jgi:hypothetical protein
MAGKFTTAYDNKLMDHLLGGSALSQLANVYLAIYSTAPTGKDDVGVEMASSTRLTIPNNSSNWNAAANGEKHNLLTLQMANITWSGTVAAIGLFDAASAGTRIFYATATTPRAYSAGDTVQWNPGDISFTND